MPDEQITDLVDAPKSDDTPDAGADAGLKAVTEIVKKVQARDAVAAEEDMPDAATKKSDDAIPDGKGAKPGKDEADTVEKKGGDEGAKPDEEAKAAQEAEADLAALMTMSDELGAGMTKADIEALGFAGARRILVARARDRASQAKPEPEPEKPKEPEKAEKPSEAGTVAAKLREHLDGLDRDVEAPQTIALLEQLVKGFETLEAKQQAIEAGDTGDDTARQQQGWAARRMDAFDGLVNDLPAEYEAVFGKGDRLTFAERDKDGKPTGVKADLKPQFAERGQLFDLIELAIERDVAQNGRPRPYRELFVEALRRGGWVRTVRAKKDETTLAEHLKAKKKTHLPRPTHAANATQEPQAELKKVVSDKVGKLRSG